METEKPEDAANANGLETTANFLARRAGDARPLDLLPFLDGAKNEPPPAGDAR